MTRRAFPMAGLVTPAAIPFALMADAVVETFSAGSPVRWWVACFAATFAVGCAITRARLAHRITAWASGLALLAMVAFTTWLPEGTTNGVRLVGLETTRVLALVAAAGVAAAGHALGRVPRMPKAARWTLAAVAAYGVIAFVTGAVRGTPFDLLVGGHSLWQALPLVFQGAFAGGLIVLPLGVAASATGAGLRTPVPGSRARTVQQTAALATTLAIVLAALPRAGAGARTPVRVEAHAASPPSGLALQTPSPERLAALENSLRAIEDGLRELPRDLWDPQYVVDQIGRDPAALFLWTRTNTFWVPYHGLLRGAVGVLMDRLGNHLDRAILLATLFELGGHTVRLARARLPRELASSMLPKLIARPSSEISLEPVQLDADVRPAMARHGLDGAAIAETVAADAAAMQRLMSEIETRSAAQAVRLTALLGDTPGRGAHMREEFEAAIEAVCDHWWVQRLEGDEWVDYDLIAESGEQIAVGMAADTVALKDVSAAQAHTVTIRVVAERSRGSAIEERRILEHVLTPADVIGQSLVLQFWPVDWSQDFQAPGVDPQLSVRTTALAQRRWEATLTVGSSMMQRAVLTDTGTMEDPRLTTNPFGGLASAFAASIDLPTGPAGQVLTAVWIEYETSSPGSRPERQRRVVFDLLGAEARASGTPSVVLTEEDKLQRSLALMMRTEILPQVCRIPPEFLANLLGDSMVQNRPLLTAGLRGDLQPREAALKAMAPDSAAAPTPLYRLAISRFDLNPFQDHIFVDRPSILTRHVFPRWARDRVVGYDAADIVSNHIGVDLLASDPFEVRLHQGVIDTNAERLARGPGAVVADIAEAFGSSTSWLRVDEPDAISGLPLPGNARRQISDDLAAGYIVIAPAAPVALGGNTFVGWWRVDGRTGGALGIGENGWGSSTAERSFLSVLAGRWAREFAFQYLLCLTTAEATAQIDTWWMSGGFAPPGEAAAQSWKGCSLFALISAGFFATLPFVTMYLAARAGMAGGYRAGFTLWLRGLRGRVPNLPRRPPKPPAEPPAPEPCSEPPTRPSSGAGSRTGTTTAPPRAGRVDPILNPRGAPYESLAELERIVADLTPKQAAAEEAVVKATADQFSAETEFLQANRAFEEAAARSSDPLNDPAVRSLREAAVQAEEQFAAAERALRKTRAELYKANFRLRHWQRMQPATARLLQAQEELDVAQRQMNAFRATPQAQACEPGSAAYEHLKTLNREYVAAEGRFMKSLESYYDADHGREPFSPPAADRTVVDPGPYVNTLPQSPNTLPVSPPGPDSPMNPMAQSVGGMTGAMNAMGRR